MELGFFGFVLFFKYLYTQCEARTYNLGIKSRVFHLLSQPGIPRTILYSTAVMDTKLYLLKPTELNTPKK